MLNDRNFTCEYGKIEPVSPLIRRIVAENPGPFTFWGTGTYIVGHGEVTVIDPGPDLPAHIDALLAALAGERIAQILVTHTHIDHSPAVKAVKAATGASSFGFGPHGKAGETGESGADLEFRPDRLLREGYRIEGRGWHLEAVHTPGHASNHLCFALPQEKALFSGDHVMGWSTTVVAPPDGEMRAYMRSLDRLATRRDAIYWPTHGGPIRDPQTHLRELIQHRQDRRASVLAALDLGAATPAEIVARVYKGLDPRLIEAAAQSVLAHLLELEADGVAAQRGDRWERRRR